MNDNTVDFLWNRINELFAETTRLKTELKQVTKERDEYSARWENLNKEVEKKFDYKASRTFAHNAFAERVDMTVMFDLDLYRASKIDMIDGLCRQVYEAFPAAMRGLPSRSRSGGANGSPDARDPPQAPRPTLLSGKSPLATSATPSPPPHCREPNPMPDTTWTPDTRYRHDADELTRLADWLTTHSGPDPLVIALDYFRLADRLAQLAEDAREFARTMAGPVP